MFTGGKYCLLGGQHISAALLQRVRQLRRTATDDAIAENLRKVVAEVLMVGAPLEICRMAAAQHHMLQTESAPLTLPDIVRFLGKVISEVHAIPPGGNPYLTDAQLWHCLTALGEGVSVEAPKDDDEDPQEALRQYRRMVCFLYDAASYQCLSFLPQKDAKRAQWRPFVFFLSANHGKISELAAKIKELNATRPGDSVEVVKVSNFRTEGASLTAADARRLGDWMLAMNEKPKINNALLKEIHHLRHLRLAVWQLNGQPDHVVHPDKRMPFCFNTDATLSHLLSGNDDTAEYLVRNVPLKELMSSGLKLSGRKWARNKRDEAFSPTMLELQTAKFWHVSGTYNHVYEYLRQGSAAPVPTIAASGTMTHQAGTVNSMDLEIGHHNRKVIFHGPLKGVAELTKPRVLYIETKGDSVSLDVLEVIGSLPGTSIILLGSEAAVASAASDIAKLPGRAKQASTILCPGHRGSRHPKYSICPVRLRCPIVLCRLF